MRLRLLDLDGSLPGQAPFRDGVRSGGTQVVDLRDLGGRLRLWAGASAMRRVRARIWRTGLGPGKGPPVTFIGSGDYHHLMLALLPHDAPPFTLVHFDNHPDWVRRAPRFHCGSWVNEALRKARRVITIGPCSDDLVRPGLKGANLSALGAGRIELYPWRHAPSWVLGQVADGASHRQVGRHLHWRNVGEDWPAFLDEIEARIPTPDVWISIDKDVLRPADATTNWDQGEMPLDALLAAVRRIGTCRRVVGIDVCGEYAAPRHRNPLKAIEAFLDQPKPDAAPDLARNEVTNAALLDAFAGLAA